VGTDQRLLHPRRAVIWRQAVRVDAGVDEQGNARLVRRPAGSRDSLGLLGDGTQGVLQVDADSPGRQHTAHGLGRADGVAAFAVGADRNVNGRRDACDCGESLVTVQVIAVTMAL
jgi:hypothetical protein